MDDITQIRRSRLRTNSNAEVVLEAPYTIEEIKRNSFNVPNAKIDFKIDNFTEGYIQNDFISSENVQINNNFTGFDYNTEKSKKKDNDKVQTNSNQEKDSIFNLGESSINFNNSAYNSVNLIELERLIKNSKLNSHLYKNLNLGEITMKELEIFNKNKTGNGPTMPQLDQLLRRMNILNDNEGQPMFQRLSQTGLTNSKSGTGFNNSKSGISNSQNIAC